MRADDDLSTDRMEPVDAILEISASEKVLSVANGSVLRSAKVEALHTRVQFVQLSRRVIDKRLFQIKIKAGVRCPGDHRYWA
jgi:hypothetical protein